MSALREAVERVRSFFHKPERDSELDAEMAAHLELATEENLRQGMSADEARRRAMVRFGGLTQAKEQHGEARGLPWLDVLMQDVRFTCRTLGRDRGFTFVAVIILGLGIGANITVFSVVNTILLRPLPFPNPQQLVRILTKNTAGGESSMTYSTDATQEFQRSNRSFASVSGYFAFSGPDNLKLGGGGQPMPVTGLMVGGNFFETLGVEPSLGRLFTPEECLHNSRPVVLLSHAFWKRQYRSDPGIVGQAIDLNKTPVTVIGVLPASFDFGSVFSPGFKVDMYGPVIYEDIRDEGNTMALIGRLKPGVSVAQAQAEVDLLFPNLPFNLRHPEYGGGYTGRLLSLKDYVSGKLRRSLIVLWCAVGLILLIVCVNLSNLLLARGAARSKEFAMRTALGAGRGRLVRQLLTESLMLSLAGALLGLGLAFGITAYLAHQGTIALPLLSSVRIDGAALAWTLLVAVAAAVFFGLVPSLRISSSNLQEALKDSGHGSSGGKRHEGLRSALIVSEIALACVLLVGAGLLLRSFLRILDVDLGFEPSRAASIALDYDDKGDAAKRSAIWQEVLRRTQAIPGVEAVGITDNLPMSRNRSWGIQEKGKNYRPGELEDTFVYIVSPGYLKAIGMHLLRGRDISWDDLSRKEGVAIINETVARRLWPGQDPVGRLGVAGGMDVRVIGVVADVHESSVEGNPGWQMYLSGAVPQFGPDGALLVVRSKVAPESLSSSVMSTLRDINPGQPAVEFRPIQQLVDHAVSPRRFFVLLVGVFAALGLILASLGIYGVISYSVTQRTQEIGIRMALGATQARVQAGVLGKTLLLASIGIATGTVASLVIANLIASLLFGTTARDEGTFLAMILLLLLVSLLAGYLPARRASRIHPMIALRNN
ncbi:MAG TPA: ABC transporter permease [Acidobacteriaceae bacterium]|nr:ABC transporter permease [Acidobacteriaceae bacterium]